MDYTCYNAVCLRVERESLLRFTTFSINVGEQFIRLNNNQFKIYIYGVCEVQVLLSGIEHDVTHCVCRYPAVFVLFLQRWTGGASMFVQFVYGNVPLPQLWEHLPNNPRIELELTTLFSNEMAERVT